MSKRGISNSESKTKSSVERGSLNKDTVYRFAGISLGGGKSDKACLCVIEYFPFHKKIFLSKVYEKIKSEEFVSADIKIHSLLDLYKENLESVSFDVPISLPLCMTCQLKCPGYEVCKEPHIRWMWEHHENKSKRKKVKKLFTPYTQRAIEMYFSSELEEEFNLQHALGANTAPLLARAYFLSRQLQSVDVLETNPKITLWRIGQALKMMKSHLRFHRHAVSGHESRKYILNNLESHNIVFLYEQDKKLMTANNHAFEAFLCALTGFLKFKDVTVKKPKGFPKNETWIDFPEEKIHWTQILNS